MTPRICSSRWTLFFSLHVLWLCSWPDICAARDLVFVINGDIVNYGTTSVSECQDENIVLGCGYKPSPLGLRDSDVTLSYISGSTTTDLSLQRSDGLPLFILLSHTLLANEAKGVRTYRCAARAYSLSVEVTIRFVERTGNPPTCASPTDEPTTQPTTQPSTGSTGGGGTSGNTGGGGNSGSSGGPAFKGLKPLIYTVASVILLGTLAIVAIITCWIRARRTFRNRIIRPNNTPQDYLDYISDNEFTPLTTSEFMASLQERPPTYNQSEEMLQQADSTSGGANTEETQSTAGHSTTQLSAAQTVLTMENEGTVIERRRQRGGSARRERQRRRRRVVIVESGDSEQPDESTVTVTNSQGEVMVTHEEEEEAGKASDMSQGGRETGRCPPQSASSSGASATESIAGVTGNNVTVLVNVQLPSLVTTADLAPAQPRSTHTPTQGEIEAIEARVNMLEVLQSPPFNAHITLPPLGPSTSENADECTSDNLIDFSSPPTLTPPNL